MVKKLVICGPKKSGKTTLIERILPMLRSRGLRVATVKHSYHEHPVDRPGADSYRHRQAGAAATLFFTPKEAALFLPAPADIEAAIDRYLGDADLVLVEGLGRQPWPKILVLPGLDPAYLDNLDPGSVKAVVGNVEIAHPALPPHTPRFLPHQHDALVDWICQFARS